jgi:hypothetical protein
MARRTSLNKIAALLFALAALPVAAQAASGPPCTPQGEVRDFASADWSAAVIGLKRNRCYGFCKAYDVEIHPDGTVLFEGRFGVTLGHSSAHIPARAARALAARFRRIGYLQMADAYNRPPHIFDGPSSVLTSIEFPGCGKRISDSHLSPQSPAALQKLEDEIDRVARTSQWWTAR